jgi:acetyl coenzyme A synthetase (ADP forming)-like protein
VSEEFPNPSHYSELVILRDGGSIHVRAIRADDRERLLRHFKGLSEQSKYHRFFGLKRTLTDEELARFTDLDFVNHVGLVATLSEDGSERFIGVARYVRGSDPSRAEVAFAVLDEHQGRGIGTVLLDHLSRVARAAGITEFEADVLGDNNRMLEVFGKSGFRVRRAASSGVIHLAFPTAETAQVLDVRFARERASSARGMAMILRPRSVAVIGASRDRGKLGGAILANLVKGGFNGPVYPVNNAARQVLGLPAYPSIGAIGAAVDLALVAVPAAAVERQLADCVHAGVRAAVVISAGFAETGGEGARAEHHLVELARRGGMRLVGPNCMGVLNTDPAIRLNATFAPIEPLAGNIGMFSQSGALGIAILDHLRTRGLGLSSFVSAGNRADVSNNDAIAYWAEDPRTDVILLYLESVGNPRKFARLAREAARAKPIVAVKSGRSAAGTRAASNHSGSLANLDIAVDALFEQAGVIRTGTLEELFDVSAMLSTQPIPRGPRVAVVTNAGGPAILLADSCEAHGLVLPPPNEKTIAELRSFLPDMAVWSNPIDLTAGASASQFERAIAAAGNDPNIDSLVAIHIPPMATNMREAADGIARGAAAVPPEKPVLAVFLSSAGAPARLDAGPRGKIPAYSFPENAAIALAAAWRYGKWRARPHGTPHALSPFARGAIRAVADHALSGAAGPRWLGPGELATILRAAGIEVAQAQEADLANAAQVAETVGYPLVAKAISPGLRHKSDLGGVIMGIASAREAEAAAPLLRDRIAAANRRFDGVLLQREIQGGIEMMAGVIADPTFGPLLLCGHGGATAELIRDVSFRLHPVTDIDAQEMIAELRSSRLLDGFRGAPPGDRAALAALMMRLSALVEIVPEIAELDLNPIKVLPPGKGAIVVDGRMLLAPLAADPRHSETI